MSLFLQSKFNLIFFLLLCSPLLIFSIIIALYMPNYKGYCIYSTFIISEKIFEIMSDILIQFHLVIAFVSLKKTAVLKLIAHNYEKSIAQKILMITNCNYYHYKNGHYFFFVEFFHKYNLALST